MRKIVLSLCILLICQSAVLASGKDKRKSIALGAFKWEVAGHAWKDIFKGRSSKNIVASLRTRINTALTQCRKYQVVERDGMDQLIDELGFMNDTDLVDPDSIKNSPQWGMFQGIHWLVIGSVTQFSEDNSGFGTSRLGGGSKKTLLLEIDLRVIDVQSARILTAESVLTRVNLGFGMVSKETGVVGNQSSKGLKESQLLNRTAGNIVQKVVAATMPIEVIGMSNQEAVLNYGSGLLSPGDRLIIYRQGETFYDEYTGLSETELIETGRLQVVTAQNIISKAKVIGKSKGVQKGDICKLADQAIDKPKRRGKRGLGRLFGRK